MEVISTMGGTLTYSDGNHRYDWNGEKVDLSVSKIANCYPLDFGIASGWAAKVIRQTLIQTLEEGRTEIESLEPWAKQICKAPHYVTKRAADVGTAVHRYAEALGHGLQPDLSDDPDIKKCQKTLGEWFQKNIKEVIDVERRLYSPKWKIAGTLDMLACLHTNQIHILDFKGCTDLNTGIKAAHVGQLTAYRSMAEEAGERIDGCTLVRFSRANGEVHAVTLKNHKENVAAFEAALHLARYKPEVGEFQR
jgi:hypothetical protein